MSSGDDVEELRERVLALEQQVDLQNEYITKILKQIPEIPERGMARFDAVTWQSPSDAHTVFLNIKKLAQKSPDGYVTREEVKRKVSSDANILKSEMSGHFKALKEENLIQEHPGDESRLQPNPDKTDEEAADLFVSNFDRADARRDKADSRGKRRDRQR
jgi:hypothetical protein